MLPNGFKPVVPANDGRVDATPIKLGVDKRQIVTVSFNMNMAGRLGLIERPTGDDDPVVVKKLVAGVNEAEICLCPVSLEDAGWGLTVTKGQNPRVQVQIPLPALFNVVAEPFRQQSMTGCYEVTEGGVILYLANIIPGLGEGDLPEANTRTEAASDDAQDEGDGEQADDTSADDIPADQVGEPSGQGDEPLPEYL